MTSDIPHEVRMKKLVVLLIVGVLALSGCATLQPDRTSIAKEYHYAVVLETQSSQNSRSHFAHPYDVELSRLKDLMGQLVYQGEAGIGSPSAKLPVFQADEIERLAPSLIEALQQAQPDQMVRFVSFCQRKGLFFSNSQKTEGAFFVTSDNQVNIAFNYIHDNRAPSETSALYHRYEKVSPLEIRDSKTPLVAEKEGMVQHPGAPMWLEVDLDRFERHLEAQDRYVASSTTANAVPDATGVNLTRVPEADVTAQPMTKLTRQDQVKRQLQFLKGLFEDGLISQAEYQDQKAKALEALY